MTMGHENMGGPATQERFAGQYGTGNLGGERTGRAGVHGGYRGGRREAGLPGEASAPELDLTPSRNGGGPALDPPSPLEGSGTVLDGLNEPTFPPAGWADRSDGTLADHPLLRGLLLELPPKGTMPPPGWLDRWFEAARSILELLYLQETPRRER